MSILIALHLGKINSRGIFPPKYPVPRTLAGPDKLLFFFSFYRNYAYTHGGGILCNGYLLVGRSSGISIGVRLELSSTKVYQEASPQTIVLGGAGMEENQTLTLTVIDHLLEYELPETGGIGTTVLYIVGGILVLGAVVLLVTKKRMASN